MRASVSAGTWVQLFTVLQAEIASWFCKHSMLSPYNTDTWQWKLIMNADITHVKQIPVKKQWGRPLNYHAHCASWQVDQTSPSRASAKKQCHRESFKCEMWALTLRTIPSQYILNFFRQATLVGRRVITGTSNVHTSPPKDKRKKKRNMLYIYTHHPIPPIKITPIRVYSKIIF
jgi:hypothetical protein